VILEMLEKGALHLTAVRLLAPHLSRDNHQEILGQARHQTRRAIEEIVARLRPLPDAPTVVRKLPEPVAEAAVPTAVPAAAPPPAAPAPLRPALVSPLSPGRYLVQVTGDAELDALLRRAHDLMGIPKRDAAKVVKRALALLVQDLERKRLGAATRARPQRKEPHPGSRHVPNAVKREVSERDGWQGTFVGEDGRRCSETFGLHFAHRKAYAKGGRATSANLDLACPPHNAYQAVQEFGDPERWKAREHGTPYGGPARRARGRPRPSCEHGAGEASQRFHHELR
jgi:hypothetical protein